MSDEYTCVVDMIFDMAYSRIDAVEIIQCLLDDRQAEIDELNAEVERLIKQVAELRDGNAKLREQNYCTMCGNILDGYEKA